MRNRHFSLGAFLEIVTHPYLLLRLPRYVRQLGAYRRLSSEPLPPVRLYPCLRDATREQSPDNAYFYQDCWAARQVFRESPEWMVDIGSTVLLVGILSQFTRCVSVDLRPIRVSLDGLSVKQARADSLPFDDGEVPCVTSMCVLEHVGLGRYGDSLDPQGTEKAAREIARVLRPGGIAVYSVPVGAKLLEFNAHRRFTYDQAASFFPGWLVVDACILSPRPIPVQTAGDLTGIADPVACFCVRKPLRSQ